MKAERFISTNALVYGVPISCISFDEALVSMQEVISDVRGASPQHICITNTESMYFARRNPRHLDYIRRSRFSLCDGIGVVIAGWFYGHRVPRRNGPIFMRKCCEYGAAKGWRHFFLGGKEGVAEQLGVKFASEIPCFQVAGTYCPPFRLPTPEEEIDMIRVINESNADVLWVSLGLPKQEHWIDQYRERLNVRWLVGVGAAFDYHTGNARWAPPVFQRLGLEWLYRLFHEPRMFVRNVRSFQFMFAAILDAIKTRVLGIKSTT